MPGKHELDALIVTGVAAEEFSIGVILSGPGKAFGRLHAQGAICLRSFCLVCGKVWSLHRLHGACRLGRWLRSWLLLLRGLFRLRRRWSIGHLGMRLCLG